MTDAQKREKVIAALVSLGEHPESVIRDAADLVCRPGSGLPLDSLVILTIYELPAPPREKFRVIEGGAS